MTIHRDDAFDQAKGELRGPDGKPGFLISLDTYRSAGTISDPHTKKPLMEVDENGEIDLAPFKFSKHPVKANTFTHTNTDGSQLNVQQNPNKTRIYFETAHSRNQPFAAGYLEFEIHNTKDAGPEVSSVLLQSTLAKNASWKLESQTESAFLASVTPAYKPSDAPMNEKGKDPRLSEYANIKKHRADEWSSISFFSEGQQKGRLAFTQSAQTGE